MASSRLKNIARRLASPVTSPVDGRVADVNRRVADTRGAVAGVDLRIDQLARELVAYATTTTESSAYVGVEMRRLQESIDMLQTYIEELEVRRTELTDEDYIERLNAAAEGPLEELEGAVANLVNRASGHNGFAAQAGLWFNPSVTVELSEGDARVATVNERIVELPFAFGALSRLSRPARVLDIGSAESTFSLSAASLGHQVTALDLHPTPYAHPNIESVVGRFEDWDPGQAKFDAAFLISTIEHFGLGAYGESATDSGADRAAVARIRELLDDGGILILTTPYGPARVDELERTYDEKALEALLEGWTVLERTIVSRRDDQTWVALEPDTAGDAEAVEQGVVMLVASPATPE